MKTLGGRWASISKVERPGTDLSFIALRKNLILDFWHLDVCDKFLLYKQPIVILCYGSPSKTLEKPNVTGTNKSSLCRPF